MPEPDDGRTLCAECERRADVALVIEALAELAGPEIDSPRDRRAWELIDVLAEDAGMTPSDLLRSPSSRSTPPEPEQPSIR